VHLCERVEIPKKERYRRDCKMKKRWKRAFKAITVKKRDYREKAAVYRLRKSPEFKYLVQS